VNGAARSRGSIWFLVLTVITLGWYGFFGAIVIMDAGVSASEAAHQAGAVLCVGIIAAGLLPQLVAPVRNVAGFQQTLMVAVAVMAAAAIEGNPNNQGGQAGPFDVVFLTFLIPVLVLAVLHPARRELLRVRRVHPLLLLLVAAVPLVVYGVDQALIQRNRWPLTSDPHHNSHWFLMAEAAFAIPLLGAVAGLGGRGWGCRRGRRRRRWLSLASSRSCSRTHHRLWASAGPAGHRCSRGSSGRFGAAASARPCRDGANYRAGS
jgi:hypothetical protein